MKVVVLEPVVIVKGLAGVNVTVPVEVLASVTVRFASAVFGLPKLSCRCTVIVPEATPAVTVTGELVITSLLAAAGLTTMVVVFVTGVKAPSVYFSLMLSARLSAKLANVATPALAVAVPVPCNGPVPLASAAVTVLLSFVTTLLKASST